MVIKNINRREALSLIGGAATLPLLPPSLFYQEPKKSSDLPVLLSLKSLFRRIETQPEQVTKLYPLYGTKPYVYLDCPYLPDPNFPSMEVFAIRWQRLRSWDSILIPRFKSRDIEEDCKCLILSAAYNLDNNKIASKVAFGIVNPDFNGSLKYDFPVCKYSERISCLKNKILLIHKGYKERFVMPYDSKDNVGFAILGDDLVSIIDA